MQEDCINPEIEKQPGGLDETHFTGDFSFFLHPARSGLFSHCHTHNYIQTHAHAQTITHSPHTHNDKDFCVSLITIATV